MGKKMNLRDLGSPEVQKQTDKELHDWTANGKGKMPAYKDKLSADEIKALVTHIRMFAK
jgi:cytochrome c5